MGLAPLSAALQYPNLFADSDTSFIDVAAHIGGNFQEGLSCVFLGRNVSDVDRCDGALQVYIGALVFGCTFNLAMAASVRTGLLWYRVRQICALSHPGTCRAGPRRRCDVDVVCTSNDFTFWRHCILL
jgi:hypothetical protein